MTTTPRTLSETPSRHVKSAAGYRWECSCGRTGPIVLTKTESTVGWDMHSRRCPIARALRKVEIDAAKAENAAREQLKEARSQLRGNFERAAAATSEKRILAAVAARHAYDSLDEEDIAKGAAARRWLDAENALNTDEYVAYQSQYRHDLANNVIHLPGGTVFTEKATEGAVAGQLNAAKEAAAKSAGITLQINDIGAVKPQAGLMAGKLGYL